jgi:CHAT domain-containing protein
MYANKVFGFEYAHPILEQVLNDLGGSVFWEENRGNPSKALARIESFEAKDLNKNDLSDYLIAFGISLLATGNPGGAFNWFNQAAFNQETPLERRLIGLILCYISYVEAFRISPDGKASDSIEITVRDPYMDNIASNVITPISNIIKEGLISDSVRICGHLLYEIYSSLSFRRLTCVYTNYTQKTQGIMPDFAPDVDFFNVFEILNEHLSHNQRAFLLLEKARCLALLGWEPDFLECWEKALQIYIDEENFIGQANCYLLYADRLSFPYSSPVFLGLIPFQFINQYGALEQSMGSLDQRNEAESYYDKAEALFTKEYAERGKAQVLLRRGALAWHNQKFEAALTFAEKARSIFIQQKDGSFELLSQVHVFLYKIALDFLVIQEKEATEYVKKWIESQQIIKLETLGWLIIRCAHYWHEKVDFLRASACSRLAQHWFEAFDSQNSKMNALKLRINYSKLLGDYLRALQISEQWLNDYNLFIHRYENHQVSHFTLLTDALVIQNSILNFYLGQKRWDKMETHAKSAEDFLKKISLEAMVSNDLIKGLNDNITLSKGLVPIYKYAEKRRIGLPDEKLLKEAEVIMMANASNPVNNLLTKITLLVEERNWEATQTYLIENVHLIESNSIIPDAFRNFMPESFIREEKFFGLHLAAQLATRVRAYNLANTYLQKLCNEFGENWWAEFNQERNEWERLSLIAEILANNDQREEARKFYEKAIDQLENHRYTANAEDGKAALAAQLHAAALYIDASRNLFLLSDFQGGITYAEMARGRALLDMLLETSAPQLDEIRNWRNANNHLARLKNLFKNEQNDEKRQSIISKTEELEESILKFKQQLRKSYPDFFQNLDQGSEVLSLAEIAAKLDKGVLMLYYIYNDQNLMCLAINSAGLLIYHETQIDSVDFSSKVHTLHRSIQNEDMWYEQALEISKCLLQGLETIIADYDDIIIVPYGVLHQLPFQVLVHKNMPIGLQKSIAYLPSGSVLKYKAIRSKDLKIQNCTIVGNPTGDLQWAITEAEKIATLFNHTPYLYSKATRKEILPLLHQADLIHLATHGGVDQKSPYDSYILLANGDKLTLSDFLEQRISAKLVVLSACETGRGEITGGDELLGLNRIVLASGAKAVIASLWKVNDFSTTIFMEEFYSNILKGKSLAEALKNAQLRICALNADEFNTQKAEATNTIRDTGFFNEEKTRGKRDFKHPFYWAPFILVET